MAVSPASACCGAASNLLCALASDFVYGRRPPLCRQADPNAQHLPSVLPSQSEDSQPWAAAGVQKPSWGLGCWPGALFSHLPAQGLVVFWRGAVRPLQLTAQGPLVGQKLLQALCQQGCLQSRHATAHRVRCQALRLHSVSQCPAWPVKKETEARRPEAWLQITEPKRGEPEHDHTHTHTHTH